MIKKYNLSASGWFKFIFTSCVGIMLYILSLTVWDAAFGLKTLDVVEKKYVVDGKTYILNVKVYKTASGRVYTKDSFGEE